MQILILYLFFIQIKKLYIFTKNHPVTGKYFWFYVSRGMRSLFSRIFYLKTETQNVDLLVDFLILLSILYNFIQLFFEKNSKTLPPN